MGESRSAHPPRQQLANAIFAATGSVSGNAALSLLENIDRCATGPSLRLDRAAWLYALYALYARNNPLSG